jgi:hypothetical protein
MKNEIENILIIWTAKAHAHVDILTNTQDVHEREYLLGGLAMLTDNIRFLKDYLQTNYSPTVAEAEEIKNAE